MTNSEIFQQSMEPIAEERDQLELWNEFIQVSENNSINWHKSDYDHLNDFNFNNQEDSITIDIYTLFSPSPELAYFFERIKPETLVIDDQIEFTAGKICVLQSTENAPPYFWTKLINVIQDGNNEEIANMETIYNQLPEANHGLAHILQRPPFNRLVENIQTRLIELPENPFFFGRSYLVRLTSVRRPCIKKYLMFMFYNDKYFKEYFIDELGLECTIIDPIDPH